MAGGVAICTSTIAFGKSYDADKVNGLYVLRYVKYPRLNKGPN